MMTPTWTGANGNYALELPGMTLGIWRSEKNRREWRCYVNREYFTFRNTLVEAKQVLLEVAKLRAEREINACHIIEQEAQAQLDAVNALLGGAE